MELAEMRDMLRIELHDEDSDNYRWTDDILDQHIEHTVRRYSIALPLEDTDDIATTEDSRDIDISSISRILIHAVEWPIGNYPPSYCRFSIFADTLSLLTTSEGDGEDARLYFGKLHSLVTADDWEASTAYSLNDYVLPTAPNGYRYKCTSAGTSHSSEPTWPTTIGGTVDDNTVEWTCEAVTSTLPEEHWDLILLGASAYALLELGNHAINRANVGEDAARQYRNQGDERLSRFNSDIQKLGSHNRLRVAGLYTPYISPVSKSKVVGP